MGNEEIDETRANPANSAGLRSAAARHVRPLIARLRRRFATQRGAKRALWILGIGLGLAGGLLAGVQTTLVSGSLFFPWLVAVAITALFGLLSGFIGLPGRIALAARIDEAHGLHSDLSNALSFSEQGEPLTQMEALAIERGVGVAGTVKAGKAAPWRPLDYASGAVVATSGAAILVLSAFALPMVGSSIEATGLAALADPGRPNGPDRIGLLPSDLRRLEALVDDSDANEHEPETNVTDKRLKAQLEGLDALIERLLEGRLSQEEAFAQLKALETEIGAWHEEVGAPSASMEQQVSEVADKRLQDKRNAVDELKRMLDAMRNRDWPEAAEAAERTAAKLGARELPRKEEEKVAKALEKLAEDLKTERNKRAETLEKERERLSAKAEKTPDRLTQKEKERLAELERELETLKREEVELSEAMRQLEKLAREYEDLARELMKRFDVKGLGGAGQNGKTGERERAEETAQRESGGDGGGEPDGAGGGQNGAGGRAEEALRRAAEILRGMGAGQADRQQAGGATERIEQVREMLRRASDAERKQAEAARQGQAGQQGQQGQQGQAGQQGKQGQAGQQGQQGQAGQQGQQGQAGQQGQQGQAGQQGQQGQAGQQGQQGQAGQQGQQGQAGQQGQQGQAGNAGENGQQNGETRSLSEGRQGAADEAAMPGQNGKSGASQGGSDSNLAASPRIGTKGAGAGHDEKLLGQKTSLDGQASPDFVAGKQGEGPSKTQIIETTAGRGFASAGYAEVIQDYREVAEDALMKESIPPGKRGYVRRYFDLIRPR